MRGRIVERFSGGREAAAEARQRGGFPCLLKALALGDRYAAEPASMPGTFPREGF